MKGRKRNKKMLGPVITIFILTFIIVILSAVFSLLQISADKTVIGNTSLESSVITVNNILTKDGIKYIFSNIIENLKNFEPIALLIMSLISISIGESSGLFKAIFINFKKINPKFLNFITLFIGICSTFIGDYSYIFLLPLVGVIYQIIGKKPMLGIITMFIGITMGYATGLIFDNQEIVLGVLTTKSASFEIDKNFTYSLSSNLYIMIFSTLILSGVGSSIIYNFLDKKFTRAEAVEDELVVSKKALYYSNLTLGIILIALVYMIIPGLPSSGVLLGSGKTYIEKLLGDSSPFYQGIPFILLGINLVCGFIYGFISKNFKNSTEFSVGLSKNFERVGYVFVLLFFTSQMLGILDYTNLGEVIVHSLVGLMVKLSFSGILLIIMLFIFVVLMSVLIPNSIRKWEMISPVTVPLLMRANIAPSFSQFIFRVADSVGKCFTPFNAYYIITLAFLEKYNTKENEKITVFGIFKLIMPVLLLFAGLWLLIVIGWYIVGLPTGPKIYPAL